MPVFDDYTPEELEPHTRKLTSLLEYIYQQPAAVAPILDDEQKRILARARTRLHDLASSPAAVEQKTAHLFLIPSDALEQETLLEILDKEDALATPETEMRMPFVREQDNGSELPVPVRDNIPYRKRSVGKRLSTAMQTLAAVLAVIVIVGGLAALFAAHRNSLSGNVIPSKWCQPSVPGLNASSSLQAIAAISSSDVWAVGYSGGSDGNNNKSLIEHWDGHAWRIVASPNLGAGDNFLDAVLALSPTDIWAVGQAFARGEQYTTQILIEHWNGKQWSIVNAPDPARGGVNRLFGISAISATDIWAVGSTLPSATDLSRKPNNTLIEHWDGKSWQVVASPNPSELGSELNSVVAISTNDVWAVGDSVSGSLPLVEHWDGRSWRVVATPDAPSATHGLASITAIAADDVWAVGGGPRTLIEHWDGKSWNVVSDRVAIKNSSQASAHLNGVIAIEQNNVWAVGNVDGYGPTSQQAADNSTSLLEHWDGQNWQIISAFKPAAQLSSVAVTPSGQIWMSGSPFGQTNAPYIAYSC